MKPVATRGITISIGMKKPPNGFLIKGSMPAKGMKRRAVRGQKKRKIKMVMPVQKLPEPP